MSLNAVILIPGWALSPFLPALSFFSSLFLSWSFSLLFLPIPFYPIPSHLWEKKMLTPLYAYMSTDHCSWVQSSPQVTMVLLWGEGREISSFQGLACPFCLIHGSRLQLFNMDIILNPPFLWHSGQPPVGANPSPPPYAQTAFPQKQRDELICSGCK